MSHEADKRSCILIVDDTRENLRLLSEILSLYGYDARPVTNGPDALRLAETELPDLILLDVTMPGMSGFEVCRELKARPAVADIPVVFLTASTEISDKVQGFSSGGVDYITKPFQAEEVVARVKNHVALRDARRTIARSLEKLRELERLRDDLVNMIVHDMRSPLTVMISNLYYVRDEVEGELRQVVDDAMGGAESLNRMANALLDVSRMEANQMPLELQACDLERLAREVASALGAMNAAKSITVEGPGQVNVRCDVGLVRRVLENLVSNGIKHTQKAGRLHILLRHQAGRARVVVQDDGPGVPVDARQRIFEKFGTAGTRSNEGYHSAGLGLAFCKLAVNAHGGDIGVEDASPSGSAFWFELPDALPSG
jgi:two-component system sensor histidine kinase/response regulator